MITKIQTGKSTHREACKQPPYFCKWIQDRKWQEFWSRYPEVVRGKKAQLIRERRKMIEIKNNLD
jgi:hypothetical protein